MQTNTNFTRLRAMIDKLPILTKEKNLLFSELAKLEKKINKTQIQEEMIDDLPLHSSEPAPLSEKPLKEVIVYSDGGCVPNPGQGAWCAVLLDPENPNNVTLSGTERNTTNNRMEIFGIVAMLRYLKTPHKITLYSDSQYLVNAINDWMLKWERQGWRHKVKSQGMIPVKNEDLFRELSGLRRFHKLNAAWVRGHNGDKWNEMADRLANTMARSMPEEVDEGYAALACDSPALLGRESMQAFLFATEGI